MNKYELAVVFAPTLEDESFQAELKSVQELIERFGGTIEKVDNWGKKKLAYEIKKVNEGYFVFISFDAEASAPGELERRMRIKENVLRYLIVRTDA